MLRMTTAVENIFGTIRHANDRENVITHGNILIPQFLSQMQCLRLTVMNKP